MGKVHDSRLWTSEAAKQVGISRVYINSDPQKSLYANREKVSRRIPAYGTDYTTDAKQLCVACKIVDYIQHFKIQWLPQKAAPGLQ